MLRRRPFGLLERQATFLGFLDCFTTLGWFVVTGVPLVFLIKPHFGRHRRRRITRARGIAEKEKNKPETQSALRSAANLKEIWILSNKYVRGEGNKKY